MEEVNDSLGNLQFMPAQMQPLLSLDVSENMAQQSLSPTSFTGSTIAGPTQAAMEQIRARSISVASELTSVKLSSLQSRAGLSDSNSSQLPQRQQGGKRPVAKTQNIARLPANALSIQYANAPFANLSLGLGVEYPLSAPTTAHLPRLATPVQRPFTAGTGSRPGSVFDTLPVQSAPDNARVGGAGEKRNTTELRPQQYMQSIMVQPTPLLAKRRKSPQGTCSSAIPRSSSSKVSTTDDASISAVSGGPFSTAMEVCGEECEPNPGILGERFPHQHA